LVGESIYLQLGFQAPRCDAHCAKETPKVGAVFSFRR